MGHRRRLLLSSTMTSLLCACGPVRSAPTAGCRAGAVAQRQRAYGLIHPLLDLDTAFQFHELQPFNRSLADRVAEERSAGRASEVSVYFRDLNNGMWTGLDESRPFTPASLLKLPLLMAVYDRIEDEPAFAGRRIEYDAGSARRYRVYEAFPSREQLTVGESYTVEELMRRMIVDSDNGAAAVLFNAMPTGSVEKAYADLGVDGVPGASIGNAVTVKQYAAFFRVLYNASYLDRRYSQRALELLAASEFKAGLAAGVPPAVTVAHKFGERLDPATGLQQVHDCGIVYHPDTPYLLCVMTRGTEPKALAAVIAGLSRLVWDEVSRQSVRAPR